MEPDLFCPKLNTASQDSEMPRFDEKESYLQQASQARKQKNKSPSRKARGRGIYGMRNEDAGWTGAWGT